MTEILFALAGTATAGLAGGAALCWPSRDRLMRSRARERVIVTLKTGATFAGLLFEVDARSLVLRDANAVGLPDGGPVPVDGELVLARHDVEYLQRP